MHRHTPRPWYCPDTLVDEYSLALQAGNGDFRMLRTLKIIRSIIVIVAVSCISLYSLYLGADPSLVVILALPSLGAYAGIEAIDYTALVQAYREAKRDHG